MTKTANIIGLTGQTGAGKSSVREILKSKGAAVIDADTVAHNITENNIDCIYDIVSHFSCLVLNERGTVNRKALGKMVFSDKKELTVLNKIIFPYILKDIEHQVLKYISEGSENVVIDGATIIESGCGKMCNVLISVTANEDTRIERIINRDKISRIDAKRRVSAQKNEDFYINNSDFVIENSGTESALVKNVNSVLKNMLLKKETVFAEEKS